VNGSVEKRITEYKYDVRLRSQMGEIGMEVGTVVLTTGNYTCRFSDAAEMGSMSNPQNAAHVLIDKRTIGVALSPLLLKLHRHIAAHELEYVFTMTHAVRHKEQVKEGQKTVEGSNDSCTS
jgi:hypothetical protein